MKVSKKGSPDPDIQADLDAAISTEPTKVEQAYVPPEAFDAPLFLSDNSREAFIDAIDVHQRVRGLSNKALTEELLVEFGIHGSSLAEFKKFQEGHFAWSDAIVENLATFFGCYNASILQIVLERNFRVIYRRGMSRVFEDLNIGPNVANRAQVFWHRYDDQSRNYVEVPSRRRIQPHLDGQFVLDRALKRRYLVLQALFLAHANQDRGFITEAERDQIIARKHRGLGFASEEAIQDFLYLSGGDLEALKRQTPSMKDNVNYLFSLGDFMSAAVHILNDPEVVRLMKEKAEIEGSLDNTINRLEVARAIFRKLELFTIGYQRWLSQMYKLHISNEDLRLGNVNAMIPGREFLIKSLFDGLELTVFNLAQAQTGHKLIRNGKDGDKVEVFPGINVPYKSNEPIPTPLDPSAIPKIKMETAPYGSSGLLGHDLGLRADPKIWTQGLSPLILEIPSAQKGFLDQAGGPISLSNQGLPMIMPLIGVGKFIQ